MAIPFLTFLLTACSINKIQSKNATFTSSQDGEILSIHVQQKISGIYPHLTTYSHGRVNGKYGFGNECGIGALAVWNNKLYMVNYAAHQPKGSEPALEALKKDDILKEVDSTISKSLTVTILKLMLKKSGRKMMLL